MTYISVSGDWEEIDTDDILKLMCCDCSLVHKIEVKITHGYRAKPQLYMKITRDNRSTGQARRKNERNYL